MTVLVGDNQFDSVTKTQTVTITIEESPEHIAKVSEVENVIVEVGASASVQFQTNDFLLYNTNLKTLIDVTLTELLDLRLVDLNTGIYTYIDQVTNFSVQANTYADLQVANLNTDLGANIATLTELNNTRATETSANAQSIVSLSADLDNEVSGLTTLYNSLDVQLDTITSSFGYLSTLNLGGVEYITGFSLISALDDEGGMTTVDSVFNVQADAFVLTDPTSGNRVKMNEDGLYFQKPDNTTYKYLQFINTFINHQNNVTINLVDVNRVPNILMSPANMPVYKTAYSDQDQSFIFLVENVVDDIEGSGTYSFTPKAELQLSSNIFNGDITGEYTDVQTETNYSDPYQVTSASSLESITINYTIDSERGTGTTNEYYYRQCTLTVQTSPDNITYLDVGTSTVKTFGASLGSITDSITYNGTMAANSYIRLKLVYANAGGTFTLGDTGYWDYKSPTYNIDSTFEAPATTYWTDCALGLAQSCNNMVTGFLTRIFYTLRHYFTEGYASAESLRDANFPGYTITRMKIDTPSHVAGGGAGLTPKIYRSPYDISGNDPCSADDPFTSLDTTNSLYFPRNYCGGGTTDYYAANVTGAQTMRYAFYLELKKWILYIGDATIYNTASNFTFNATASAATVLAEGTLNIIVVE